MPLPDRPVEGAEVETEWGQAVHDYVFAPSGFKVHGATNTAVGTSFSKHALASVDEDPGGYLDAANNQIEVVTGGDGLWVLFIELNTVNGGAGSGNGSRTALRLNSTNIAWGKEDNNGATNVTYNVTWVGLLSGGDILNIWSQKIGSGTAPDITVNSFVGVRLGAEFGA